MARRSASLDWRKLPDRVRAVEVGGWLLVVVRWDVGARLRIWSPDQRAHLDLNGAWPYVAWSRERGMAVNEWGYVSVAAAQADALARLRELSGGAIQLRIE